MRILKYLAVLLACVCLAGCGSAPQLADSGPGAVQPGGRSGIFEPEGGIALRWAELDDGTVGIVGPKEQEPKGKVIIPDEIEGIPVTVIDPYDPQLAGASLPNGGAFLAKEGITGLTIGKNVAAIGFESFLGCTNLAGELNIPPAVRSIGQSAFAGTGIDSVRFSEGLQSICAGAFYDCPNLKGEVTLPASLQSIYRLRQSEPDPHLFLGCKGVAAIRVAEQNQNYKSIDGVLYKRSENGLVLVECPQGKTGKFRFPKGVKGITSYAFEGCSLEGEIHIPDEVIRLGREFDDGFEALGHVFAKSKNITAVSIGKGIVHLPLATFEDCTALQQVTLPAELVSLDADAFKNCSALKTIVYQGTKEQWQQIKNREAALKNLPGVSVQTEG